MTSITTLHYITLMNKTKQWRKLPIYISICCYCCEWSDIILQCNINLSVTLLRIWFRCRNKAASVICWIAKKKQKNKQTKIHRALVNMSSKRLQRWLAVFHLVLLIGNWQVIITIENIEKYQRNPIKGWKYKYSKIINDGSLCNNI